MSCVRVSAYHRPLIFCWQGSSFVDHVVVSVRGGTGGSGTAAFVPMKSSSSGPPSGGNGGAGGAVYFTTSPRVSSLSGVPKRIRGGQGSNGLGSYRHGRKGEDVVIELPVGTVVQELARESDEERVRRDEAALGFGEDELRVLRRSRTFVKHPSGEISDDDYVEAERTLWREGRIRQEDRSEAIEFDIDQPLDNPVLISPGGLGGLGNTHFVNPLQPHKPPRLASRGTTPSTITLSLELKLLADVGLVGFPNAGKSTILRALTGRRAEVAEYQFTTLNPQVGVVRVLDDGTWRGGLPEGEMIEETWRERAKEAEGVEKRSSSAAAAGGDAIESARFTISDNPGLLPLASENYGLGHSFLRSIERSLVLAYVLDLGRPSPNDDMRALEKELEAYKPGLSRKSRLVIINKADDVDEQVGKAKLAAIELGQEMELVVVSAKYGLGMSKVVHTLARRVEEARRHIGMQ